MTANMNPAPYDKRLAHVEMEHSRIAEMLKKASRAADRYTTAPEINTILLEISGYTLLHFREEEALMQFSEYPELAAHKQEHEIIAGHIRKLLDMHSKKDALQGAVEALQVWLENHIRVADAPFVEFMRTKEVKA